MKTTLYLVRHGTTYENLKRMFQGTIDSALTEDGIRQAEELGKYFKDIHLDVAYMSPLSRAVRTMEGVLRYHPEVKSEIVEGLIEINGGLLQGLTFDECNRRYDNIMLKFREESANFAAPGGESMADVYRRFTSCVNELMRRNPGKAVVIVAHGTVIQTWLSYAQGYAEDDVHFQFLPNGAVSVFHWDENWKLEIEKIGDISYMEKKPEDLIIP
ncbi:MAG: histidine phosphatase family protein [Lachnospiraceae bacterium]|nr:histidine phosphatase family protein [Lachnospiraceae bacterium]